MPRKVAGVHITSPQGKPLWAIRESPLRIAKHPLLHHSERSDTGAESKNPRIGVIFAVKSVRRSFDSPCSLRMTRFYEDGMGRRGLRPYRIFIQQEARRTSNARPYDNGTASRPFPILWAIRELPLQKEKRNLLVTGSFFITYL